MTRDTRAPTARGRILCSALALALALPASLGGAEDVFFAGFKVYVGNLHSHTAFSDGSLFPEDAFAGAKNAGLQFMAVTEHNHTDGIHPREPKGGKTIGSDPSLYQKLIATAGARTQTGSFIAYFGQEFSSSSGGNHINVIGPQAVISETEIPSGEYKKFYESWLPAHPEVSFIQFNHPWQGQDPPAQNYGRHQFAGSFERLLAAAETKLRTIEVINGPGLSEVSGRIATVQGEPRFKEFLSHGFRIAPTADQDNHYKTWGRLTDARTGVLASDLTEASLTAAIVARRTFASTDKNLRAALAVNGHIMGSEITAASRDLTIAYKIADADEPNAKYDVKIVVGSSVGGTAPKESKLISVQGDSAGEVHCTTPHNNSFVYLKIVQQPQTESEKDYLLTSPVWIRIE